MKTISGIEFASEHNGTDVFRLIELAYEQGQKDGHSEQLGTNLAEVGTDLAAKRTVKGFPIDADLLMLKVEEEYGFMARDRLYKIIRTMPKYELPSAEEESFEWCTDCKEYDQEAHCCHRWSKMIWKTMEEMQIVHCCECKWFQCNMSPDGYLPEGVDEFECRHWCGSCDPIDFCSYAERREENNESN